LSTPSELPVHHGKKLRPLVTIGMPVRNGGALLREALMSVVTQDYPYLEIIVSDNCSSDETAGILEEFQRHDDRIRVLTQQRPLTLVENFSSVLQAARGEFFAWAAHDDTRSVNFVSRLLTAFDDSDTVLAFGDLRVRTDIGAPAEPVPFDFETSDASPIVRMRRQAFIRCYHFYGLWRADFLRSLQWLNCSWWPDLPLLVTAAALGTFRYVPGADFIYLQIHKSPEQRAITQSFTKPASLAANVLELLRATWLTAYRYLPLRLAIVAFLVVLERELRGFLGWVWRRLPLVPKRRLVKLS
jgi:glycosyltransferase involved in cell wall biosynthesis